MENSSLYRPEDDDRDPSRELQLPGDPTESPFDQIRHVDERGEYWTGRELMELMAYTSWRQFGESIARAKAAAEATGLDVEGNFEVIHKVSGQRGPARQDYRLTRDAAYLVAMNGDPRKSQVAAAQRYFTAQTRKQELAEQAAVAAAAPSQEVAKLDDLDTLERTHAALGKAIAVAKEERTGRIRAEAKIKALEPVVAEIEQHRAKAEYVDVFVDGRQDVTSFRVYCTQIDVPERKFREHLIAKGIIYRKPICRRWSRSQGVYVVDHEYHPRADYKKWFHVKDQPEAPRHHNNQVRTTLYVTPLGKVKLQDWLGRHPLGGAA